MPWVVSGRGQAALRAQAGRLAGLLRDGGLGGGHLGDAGYWLAAGRAVFEDRAVVLAADADGFAQGLTALAAGEPAANVVTGRPVRPVAARWCSCSRGRAASGRGWRRG